MENAVCGNCKNCVLVRSHIDYFSFSECTIDGHCVTDWDYGNYECKEWIYFEN